MFSLMSYTDKVYEIKWYIDDKLVDELEQLMYVKFKKENEYYLLEEVFYTYSDILTGLINFNFVFVKKADHYSLRITSHINS